MRCINRPLAWLSGLNQLVGHAIPVELDPAPLVILLRFRTVAKVESIGFVVLRWIQCAAGKVVERDSCSTSSVILATAFGNLVP
jgi:hypothetical protein